jgi:hypothetical protein
MLAVRGVDDGKTFRALPNEPVPTVIEKCLSPLSFWKRCRSTPNDGSTWSR